MSDLSPKGGREGYEVYSGSRPRPPSTSSTALCAGEERRNHGMSDLSPKGGREGYEVYSDDMTASFNC